MSTRPPSGSEVLSLPSPCPTVWRTLEPAPRLPLRYAQQAFDGPELSITFDHAFVLHLLYARPSLRRSPFEDRDVLTAELWHQSTGIGGSTDVRRAVAVFHAGLRNANDPGRSLAHAPSSCRTETDQEKQMRQSIIIAAAAALVTASAILGATAITAQAPTTATVVQVSAPFNVMQMMSDAKNLSAQQFDAF